MNDFCLYTRSNRYFRRLVFGESITSRYFHWQCALFHFFKMSNVFVLIYSFRFLKFFWLEHTEIRVHDRDIAYGKDGITIKPAQTRPDMILKRIIDCGQTEIDELDVLQWLMNINQFFTRQKYNLWWNNCRNFTQSLLNFLEPDNRIEGIKEFLIK